MSGDVRRLARVRAAFALATAATGVAMFAVAAQRPGAKATSPAANDSASPRVRAGMQVRPDTVRVGDFFELVVRIAVPSGARIEWPTIDDTSALVVMRAPVQIDASEDDAGRTETARYALAAWDVGALPIGLPDAIVRVGGTMTHVPLASARVVVTSVLPGDTLLHKPKPAKQLFPRVVPWWERWWPALVVLAALVLLWWLYRRYGRRVSERPLRPIDTYRNAQEEFERLERLGLVEAGEGGRYVTLAVEIVRAFIASKIPAAGLSLTSTELLRIAADDDRVPPALASLLADADDIKFAQQRVPAERARALVVIARDVVTGIDAADRARRDSEWAQRRERERLDREDAETENDAARRRARAGAA